MVCVFRRGEEPAARVVEDDQHGEEGHWLRDLRDDLYAGRLEMRHF